MLRGWDQFEVVAKRLGGEICSARAEQAKKPKIEAMIARERTVFIGAALFGGLRFRAAIRPV